MFISKTKLKESIFWPLFQKGCVPKLQNTIFTKIPVLLHRYGLVLFEFKANLQISRLDLRQKCPVTEILCQKIIIWGKFLIKTFEATPFSLLCPYLHPLNYHDILKYNMEAFQKMCAPSCAKLYFFLRLSLGIQEPLKKCRHVKIGLIEILVPNFVFFSLGYFISFSIEMYYYIVDNGSALRVKSLHFEISHLLYWLRR